MNLLGFVLSAARTLPAVWLLPLGAHTIVVRLVVGLLLSLAVATQIDVTVVPTFLMLLREGMVGLTLGLLATLPFRAAEVAGALVDRAIDPSHEEAPGRFELLLQLLALMLFGLLSGPRLWMQALAQSYRAIPIGAQISGAAGVDLAIETGAQLLVAGIVLAAPILCALLIAQLLFALLLRLQPAMAQVVERTALRTWVAVAMFGIGCGPLVRALQKSFLESANFSPVLLLKLLK